MGQWIIYNISIDTTNFAIFSDRYNFFSKLEFLKGRKIMYNILALYQTEII